MANPTPLVSSILRTRAPEGGIAAGGAQRRGIGFVSPGPLDTPTLVLYLFILKALIKSKMMASHVIPLCGSLFTCHVEKPSAAKGSYVPRRANILQGILRAHFEGFADIYDRQYARRYGRFHLERIAEAVTEFLRCGDYRFGVARPKCSNPSCACEMFRPFSCKTFYLCPSCSQKRTLLFAEFLSEWNPPGLMDTISA